MSALLSTAFTRKNILNSCIWPIKNFPNNAIITASGLITLYALPKILNTSNYYTILLGGLTLAGIRLYQMNNLAKKQLLEDKEIQNIKKEIYELEGFDKNNYQIMNLYLQLGKENISSMFNHFNETEYSKIVNL